MDDLSMDDLSMDDLISKLPNDILLKFLERLSTKEAVRTSILSKRWTHVWKEMSDLLLDMRSINRHLRNLSSPYVAFSDATSMTKVINNHEGQLERCTIIHYSHQCNEEMVEAWIQSLIHTKHTKHLTLVNIIGRIRSFPNIRFTLDLSPQLLSHPRLESLYLVRYELKTLNGFNNCWNLKKLKLIDIYAEIGVFNAILLSCASLQVLVLNITCYKRSGVPLKIENRNLKFLSLTCYQIDGVEVASPNLDILTVGSVSCGIDKFVIANPRLKFNRNYWTTGKIYSHTSYNLSCANQEKKSIGHEFMMSESVENMKRFASMSLSIDLKSSKEVDMLREILLAWPLEMAELEIVFKKSITGSKKELGESSSGRTQKKFWEKTKPFPCANFHAYTVWLFEFSGSEEEFVFASRFIMQGTVVRNMIIKPSSNSQINKLMIEEIVANLKTLPKRHKQLKISMF